ncbi:MAG: L,D-transpeptidase family protein [Brevirhabdus sp.]
MRIISAALLVTLVIGLGACSKFKTYDGPEVTRIVVHKSSRQMVLYSGDQPLEAYDVELGFQAEGPKEFEGDGKTPEGRYTINRRNPNSAFHLSLGISYPNAEDRAHARASGKSPGGDIFIHGQKSFLNRGGDDWTAGCIAVTNKEIQDIYAMVRNGTVIDIYP